MSRTTGAVRATLRLGIDGRGPTFSISRIAVISCSSGPSSFLSQNQAQRWRRQLISAPNKTLQRYYSLESAAQKSEPPPPEHHHQQSTGPNFSPSAANPPATTRPPPLSTPTRQPNTTTFQHLFATGKAYLTFYKNGLKNIYHNTRLLYPSSNTPPSSLPQPNTRSHFLLRARWSHDIRRLPIFILLFIVCGEFTPFVVVALPHIVPLTCRIPQHVAKLQKQLEARRAHSQADYYHANQSSPAPPTAQGTAAHLARSLGLVSSVWDRLGWVPGAIARPRVERRVRFLVEDSELLLRAGGVAALEDEEVRLACADRGIDVTGRGVDELRDVLERWLRMVIQGHSGGRDESTARVVALLQMPEGEWPEEY